MENIHILLADDDEDDRSFFQDAITEAAIPAIVTMVEDGLQLTGFLDVVANPPSPDVIFLDINMPYKNGKKCLQEIRQEKKFDNVPVAMFSTSSEKKDIEETYAYGANLCVNKSDFFDKCESPLLVAGFVFCRLSKLLSFFLRAGFYLFEYTPIRINPGHYRIALK